MPLPYRFLSGTVARSSEVNANFDYVMDAIGQASGPGGLSPTGRIVLGPRSSAILSAAWDAGGGATDHVQLSWNVDTNKSLGYWKHFRIMPNAGGSLFRVGARGIELYGTGALSGDIQEQLQLVFRVDIETYGMFMVLPDYLHISNVDDFPANLGQNRNTIVFLEAPVAIYKNTAVGTGTSVLSAFNYGIPRHANAIIINAHVTAASNSGAGMHFYQQSSTSPIYHGFVAHAPITGTGMGMRTGAQGMVPLGRGPNAGNFVITRTAPFELANVYIIGYLT